MVAKPKNKQQQEEITLFSQLLWSLDLLPNPCFFLFCCCCGVGFIQINPD
jgi:hypothetical protein